MTEFNKRTNYFNRTLAHIHRVQSNMVLLVTQFAERFELTEDQCRKAVHNVLAHDRSKFSPEQFEPYIELTELYRQRKLLKNTEYGYQDGVAEKVHAAVKAHYLAENHHPEKFEGTIGKWDVLEALEAACDLQAMAQEFDEGSARGYFEKHWRPDHLQYFYDDYNWACVEGWMRTAFDCFEIAFDLGDVFVDREVIPEIGCLRAFDLNGRVRFQDGRPAEISTYKAMNPDGWTPERLEEVMRTNSSLVRIGAADWKELVADFASQSVGDGIAHAETELRLAGFYDEDADYGSGTIADAVLDLMRSHASQGHSGASSELALSLFSKLTRHQSLSPLTNSPAEWFDLSKESGEPMWQSRRQPTCFSRDGGKTYYDLDRPGHDFVSHPVEAQEGDEADKV